MVQKKWMRLNRGESTGGMCVCGREGTFVDRRADELADGAAV